MFLLYVTLLLLHYYSADASVLNDTTLEGPHPIVQTSIKQYFASVPPLNRCDQGFLGVFCRSLQLLPEQMDPMLALTGKNSSEINMDVYDTSRRLLMEEAFTEKFRKLAERDAMRRLEVALQAVGKNGEAKWNPELLYAQRYREIQHLGTAIEMFMKPLVAKLLVDSVKVNLLKLEYEQNMTLPIETIQEAVLAELLKDNPMLDLLKANNNVGFSLLDVPEVLLGWTSSRIVSRLLQVVIGAIVVDVDIKPTSILLSLFLGNPGINLGWGACDGAYYSQIYDFDPQWCTCAVMDMFSYALICPGSSPSPPNCTNSDQPAVPDDVCQSSAADLDPTKNTTIVDLTLEPGPFSEDVLSVEGYKYYFLYRGIVLAGAYTSTAAFCDMNNPVPNQIVPGWKTVFEVRTEEDGEPLFPTARQEAFPVALVSQRYSLDNPDDKPTYLCDFLITLRGTSSGFEWLTDFSFALVPNLDGNFTSHAGFTKMVFSYLPSIEAFFDRVFSSGTCDCASTHIMVTGHSLGGATGELVALHLGTKYGETCGAKIDGVFFAPPRSLSPDGYARLAEVVNVRSFVYELDFVPYFPCAQKSGLPRCNPDLNLVTFGEGWDLFGEHVNQYIIPSTLLAEQNPLFGQQDFGFVNIKINFADPKHPDIDPEMGTPGALQLDANHVCSYGCWATSQFCGFGDTPFTWMCQQSCLLFTGDSSPEAVAARINKTSSATPRRTKTLFKRHLEEL